MSVVTQRLRSRSVPRATADAEPTSGVDEPTTLDLVRRGRSATVVGFDHAQDGATARRLHDLGFVPGATVEVRRRAPMGDPVVYRVAGYDIALRRAQARCIRVVPTP